MSEYEELKSAVAPILERAGLSLVVEERHPDVFGSAYCEYKGKGLQYRIIWDGKDGYGYIQSMTKQGWQDLDASVPEGKQSDFASALTVIRIKLIEHIAVSKMQEA
jgi:hypothetical protein